MIKTTALLHVHDAFSTFLWCPLRNYDMKPPNLTFYGTNFPSSFWTWIKFIFLATFSLPPSSSLLKVPTVNYGDGYGDVGHFICWLKEGEAKVAQWWKHPPPTNVAWFQIPASTPYVGWVCCWFSLLLQEVFLLVLLTVFPSPHKLTFPNSTLTRNEVDE